MAMSCARDIVDLTGSIQGFVKDASSGQMIENCQVSLMPSGKSVITSSSGSFEFKDLDPGDYTLTFNRTGYNVDSKHVTVVAGDVVKADISLTPIQSRVGNIYGIVKDLDSGQMIENCQITISPTGNSVITTKTGDYEFKNLEPGDYTLTFSKSGYDDDIKKVSVVAGENTKADMFLKAKSPFALSEEYYDFGDLESSKSFNVYNNSGSDCSYTFGTVPQWLVLNKKSGSVDAGSNDSFTVSVDRSKVNVGEYSHNIVIDYKGQSSGSAILEVRMKKVEYSAPEVTTAGVATEITKNSFKIEGAIVKTGGAQITAFGHCWSTTSGATVDGNRTNLGMTDKKEVFVSTIEGLQVNTEYYVRAYATNQYGTSYGEEIKVRTQDQECDVWDGNIAQSFAGGSGTAGSPYLIETGGQLMLMKHHSNKNFKLMNNIDLNNNNWMPFNFSGTLDGNGFTIYNLRIHRNQDNIGLFAVSTGEIKNVKIDGVDIEAPNSTSVGAIAGYGKNIQNCVVWIDKGIVANSTVGGIAGSATMLKNCKVYSKDNAKIAGDDNLGGVVGSMSSDGYSSSMTLEGNHAVIDITGNMYVGGCVGCFDRMGFDKYVHNCSYSGSIDAYDYVGGIVGCAGDQMEIISCFADVNLVAHYNSKYCKVAGIAASYSTEPLIIACYSTGNIEVQNESIGVYVVGSGGAFDNMLHHCYSTILTNGKVKFTAIESVYIADSDDIARDMKEMYSEYASYWDYSNTWTWTGEVNGVTKSVKCPKLKWE